MTSDSVEIGEGYEPPESVPGTLYYEYRPDQAHVGFTNNNEPFSTEVLDWLMNIDAGERCR